MELLGRGVGPGPRVHQVHPPRLLDAEREHEVLDPEVRHVGAAGDVQVLEGGAALKIIQKSCLKSYSDCFNNIY